MPRHIEQDRRRLPHVAPARIRATDRVAFCDDLVAHKKKSQPFTDFTQLGDTGLVSPCEIITSDAAAAEPP